MNRGSSNQKNILKLIVVLIISATLFSCSNSAKKEATKTESTSVDTTSQSQELPEYHDSVAVVIENQEKEKPTSRATEGSTPKQDVTKAAEPTKEYALPKPVKSIKKEYQVITHSESLTQSIKHAIPPPSGTVVLPPQKTAEAHYDEIKSADTTAIGTGNPASEPVKSTAPEVSVPKKKSARLAYNYSSEMKRNVSEDINVYVSIVNSGSFVKDTLMKIIAQQKNPNTRKSNTDSIVTTNILLYKRIRVELIDPDSAFKIEPIYGEAWQDVDSIGDNRWRWSVIPLTNQPSAKLVIKVVAETPAVAIQDIDDRTFYIKVEMTGPLQMIRTLWAYLQDHPELFLTVIIIPLIAFFGKRYFERKSKDQKP